MKNIRTRGSGRKYVNEDYPIVGTITAYDPTCQKITFRKTWDLGATNFYAIAVYPGRAGAPSAEEIHIGAMFNFFRTGKGNNNFSSTPTEMQKNTDSTAAASFVAFIRVKSSNPEPQWDEYYAYKSYGVGDTPTASFFNIAGVDYAGFKIHTLSCNDFPYFVSSRTLFSQAYTVKYYNDLARTSLYWETARVIFEGPQGNHIVVEQAGTEVVGKLSLYPPGVHPYDLPSVEKYIVIEETKGTPLAGDAEWGNAIRLLDVDWGLKYFVELGDRVTTTNPARDEIVTDVCDDEIEFSPGDPIHAGTEYIVHFKSRKGSYRSGDEKLVGVNSRWLLNIYKSYGKYNPATDTTGAGDYCCAQGAKIHNGINEEAQKHLFYFHDPDNHTHNHAVPGWPGIKARYYTEAVQYKTGHRAAGGRLYATRAKESWLRWDPYWYIWYSPNALEGFGNLLSVADQWGGKQRHDTCNFMLNGPLLFF